MITAMPQIDFDTKAFRDALGQFATGVTIVTTLDPDGNKAGLTVNSFNSASLNPPLVLWSLAKTARAMAAFDWNDYFNVHVLTSEQTGLSNQFASPLPDRFAGVELEQGITEIPLLVGCAARFQCKKVYSYEGGDHVIFVGEVLAFDRLELEPLLFHSGHYAMAKPQGPDTTYTQGFLLHLFDRCYWHLNVPFQQESEKSGLSLFESKVLAFLSGFESIQLDVLRSMEVMLDEPFDAVLDRLDEKGLVDIVSDNDVRSVRLTGEASQRIAPILAAGRAAEEIAFEDFSLEDRITFKKLLVKIALKTNPELPNPPAVDPDG